MLRVNDLNVSLGGRHILRNISFSAPDGSFIAILGPNGGGKSTLLKTLAGLIPPDSGLIECDACPERDPAHCSGYVPQIKALDRTFPARVVDLVITAVKRSWALRTSHADRTVALDALGRVGASHLADQSINTLSGGELQRVYLARSIIRRPRLLLLDEPETGIDSRGTSDLQTLLESYRDREKASVVMATHDWEVAFHHASHVLLLNGDQISFGAPDEALTDASVRRAYGHVGHTHTMLGRHMISDGGHRRASAHGSEKEHD